MRQLNAAIIILAQHAVNLTNASREWALVRSKLVRGLAPR
jgi:hypothetical protein